MNMPQQTPMSEQAKERAALTSRQLRRQRLRRIAIVSALCVGLPTLLAAIYYGAMYGGTITSVLINVPGEAASVVTCLDGYEMAKQGQTGDKGFEKAIRDSISKQAKEKGFTFEEK